MLLIRTLLLFISLFTCATLSAQVNLVRNGNLEKHDSCPNGWDEIKYAKDWMSLDSAWSPPDWSHTPPGVPDYCNVCSVSPLVAVPHGLYYHHYPHSNEGMAIVQMLYDHDTAIWARDYLQGHLYSLLTSGQSYCVSFYVTLVQASGYAVNHIGAYLDNGIIDSTHLPGAPQTQYVPQVYAASIIADTSNWTKIQGNFVSNGTERLITIGNFTSDAHTTYIAVKDTTGGAAGTGFVSWYLVDDICVMRSDAIAKAGPDRVITSSHDTVMVGDTLDSYLPTYWYAGGRLVDSNKGGFMIHVDTTTTFVVSLDVCGHITYDTMIIAVSTEMSAHGPNLNNVTVFPNPTSTELTVEHANGAEVVMYDVVGREVLKKQINQERETMNIATLANGVYVVQLSRDGAKRNVRVQKE